MADKHRKKLLDYYSDFNASQRQSLLDYAGYLHQLIPEKNTPLPEPKAITPARDETVVGAMQRLSESYSMVNKDHILHELSALMAQHMLQGRAADEVIKDIEAVFNRQYQRLLDKQAD
jgi:hypothetical protein